MIARSPSHHNVFSDSLDLPLSAILTCRLRQVVSSIHYRTAKACRSARYLSPNPSRTAQTMASPRVLTPILL